MHANLNFEGTGHLPESPLAALLSVVLQVAWFLVCVRTGFDEIRGLCASIIIRGYIDQVGCSINNVASLSMLLFELCYKRIGIVRRT